MYLEAIQDRDADLALALLGTGAISREQADRIQAVLDGCPQIETPLRHFLAGGLYVRTMFIPAGTVIVGAVHKTEHLALCIGDLSVWDQDGMRRLCGHHTFLSRVGAKRVGYAHADTWFSNFFPTMKTDIAELEEELVEEAHLLSNRKALFAPATPCLKEQFT